MTIDHTTAADGYPTERDYLSPGELHCGCRVSKLLPKHRELWNWVNASLIHGTATQAEVVRRLEAEAPEVKVDQGRISHHLRRHLRRWLATRPEYRIRADLMEKLAKVADEGGMALPEIMNLHARIAGLVMNAQAIEAYGSLDPEMLVRQSREAAVAADMAESRAVQRARVRMQTQEGQKRLFAEWRGQMADELRDPEALATFAWDVLQNREQRRAFARIVRGWSL